MPPGGASRQCIFCQIARSSSSSTSTTTLLHSDDKVVAFQDINPSAFRHYLVIPLDHIPTVRDLHKNAEDYSLVSHMLTVGKTLLLRDAPESEEHRFGFHPPPYNSIYHLHLHCLALPFSPGWKQIKYTSQGMGPYSEFIEAEELLENIKPLAPLPWHLSAMIPVSLAMRYLAPKQAQKDNTWRLLNQGGHMKSGGSCFGHKLSSKFIVNGSLSGRPRRAILRSVQRQTEVSICKSPPRTVQHCPTGGFPILISTRPPSKPTHAPSFTAFLGQLSVTTG